MGDIRNACKIILENPEGKRPLGKPWQDGKVILKFNLKM
jgi:hypothetical protein